MALPMGGQRNTTSSANIATDSSSLNGQNDLLAITTHINGAFNGFEDRRKLLAAAFIHLKACLERSESRQEGSEPSVG